MPVPWRRDVVVSIRRVGFGREGFLIIVGAGIGIRCKYVDAKSTDLIFRLRSNATSVNLAVTAAIEY